MLGGTRVTNTSALRPGTHLQVDFIDSTDIVCHPAEDETAHAGRDADTHEQNFFIGVFSKTLLHVLHLWTIKETDEHSCLMAQSVTISEFMVTILLQEIKNI